MVCRIVHLKKHIFGQNPKVYQSINLVSAQSWTVYQSINFWYDSKRKVYQSINFDVVHPQTVYQSKKRNVLMSKFEVYGLTNKCVVDMQIVLEQAQI